MPRNLAGARPFVALVAWLAVACAGGGNGPDSGDEVAAEVFADALEAAPEADGAPDALDIGHEGGGADPGEPDGFETGSDAPEFDASEFIGSDAVEDGDVDEADDGSEIVEPIPYEYAIKVINRPMIDVVADLPRFASRDLTLYLCVHDWDVGNADFATVLEEAQALGVRVKLWPLLLPEEGAWCNEDNQQPFWANVFALLDFIAVLPHNVQTIVINSELGSPKIDLIQQYFSAEDWPALIELIKGNYDAPKFVEAQARQQAMVDELHARGFEAQITTYPYLLDDLADGDPDIQDAANVVLEGVTWDRLAFTPYSAAYTADFGKPYGPYFVYSYAKLARELYGERADIALGLVMPGDPHSYTEVGQLAADVAAVKAAGVQRIDLFDLNGMLDGDRFDEWADALLAEPAEPPPEATTAQFHQQFKAADLVLDSEHEAP